MSNVTFVPALGRAMHFVDREQLRFRLHGRTLCAPLHLRGLHTTLPAAPATVDWSKHNTLQFPILGNDQAGDCFYAAMCHASQTWTGNVGQQAQFDTRQVLNRYYQLSGGDNGLDDATVFPEWRRGIVGPNGPHTIEDEMTVDVRDPANVRLAMYLFGGLIYTASLPNAWLNTGPGSTWDASYPNPQNGHAMWLTGDDGKTYKVQTWGFNPPVNLTYAGLQNSDPELVVCFSREWFDPATGKAPNGYSWEELRQFWVALGGKDVGPSPFAPAPTTTGVPTTTPAPVPLPPAPTPIYPGQVVFQTHIPVLGSVTLAGTLTAPRAAGFTWPNFDFVAHLAQLAIALLEKGGPLLTKELADILRLITAFNGQDYPAILAALAAAQVDTAALIDLFRQLVNGN